MGLNYFNPNDLYEKTSSPLIKTDKENQNMADLFDVKQIYSLAEQRGIKTFPLDIRRVISDIFHINILEEDLGKISGYIENRPSGCYIIINCYENEKRKRFTLAHELAHYILHADMLNEKHEDIILFRNNNFIDKNEKQANDYASDLLIPEDKFRDEIDRGNKIITNLANTFNVSIAAIRYKAFKLGLIKDY